MSDVIKIRGECPRHHPLDERYGPLVCQQCVDAEIAVEIAAREKVEREFISAGELHLADEKAARGKVERERDELAKKAAHWHRVADLLNIAQYGCPCDDDAVHDAALVKPLVEALRSTGAVLSELFGDSEDCDPKLSEIMAQIDAALAPYERT